MNGSEISTDYELRDLSPQKRKTKIAGKVTQILVDARTNELEGQIPGQGALFEGFRYIEK